MPGMIPRPAGGLAELSPSNFGMVMATGIISLAAQDLGLGPLARALFHLNLGFYLVLCALTVTRAARHPHRFFGDMVDHRAAPGYFTAVAGTSLLAGQFLVLNADVATATALALLALALWLLLTYAVFAGLTISARKPALQDGISGAWLLAVVATQSLAVIAALLAPSADAATRQVMHFLALAVWLWGGMLYIWIAALIFYRYCFFPLAPEDLSPSYWINMGAMAISTLAGSLLLANAPGTPLLESMTPFIKGFTLFCWAAGTWWIPLQLILSVWRYAWRGSRIRYEPLCWGVVFPLGMYAASTWQMAHAFELVFLDAVPPTFLGLALLAWLLAASGLVSRLARQLRVSVA